LHAISVWRRKAAAAAAPVSLRGAGIGAWYRASPDGCGAAVDAGGEVGSGVMAHP